MIDKNGKAAIPAILIGAIVGITTVDVFLNAEYDTNYYGDTLDFKLKTPFLPPFLPGSVYAHAQGKPFNIPGFGEQYLPTYFKLDVIVPQTSDQTDVLINQLCEEM